MTYYVKNNIEKLISRLNGLDQKTKKFKNKYFLNYKEKP